MERVKVLVLFVVTYILSATADDTESMPGGTEASNSRSRSPRISSEFGFRLQNTEASSQFRQEHRDTDGNVRGSYGFENPNGKFRFVHYVADDKGFRAHISSNEPGVGRQNPASVSINRYEHRSVFIDDPKPTHQPPTSGLRRQSSEQRKEQVRPHPSRYDFYSPVQTDRTEIDKTSVLDDPYRSILNSQTYKQSFQRSPVEEFIRAKLDVPDGLRTVLHDGSGDNLQSYWEQDPLSLGSLYRAWVQTKALKNQREQPGRTSSSSYDPNSDLSTFMGRDNLRTRAQTHDYVHDYAPLFSNLRTNLKHKVHTSLPDCTSASSAVLCKPPNLISEVITHQSSKDLADMTVHEALRMLASRGTANSDDLGFSSINELQGKIQPLPRSNHANEDRLSFKYSEQKQHQECNKNHFSATSKDGNHYATSSHKLHGEQSMFSPYDIKNTYDHSSVDKQSESNSRSELQYSPSLVHFLQNNQNLGKLKQILSKVTHPTDSVRQEPKLSFLGILILPSSILNELNDNTASIPQNPKHDAFDDNGPPSSFFGPDGPGSGAAEQPENVFEESSRIRNKPEVDVNEQLPTENASRNETAVIYSLSPTYLPQHNNKLSGSNQANGNETGDPMKESGFFIFDDPEFVPDDRNAGSSNLTSGNWRKMLEDEMRKDYERTSSQQDKEGVMDSVLGQRQPTLDDNIDPLYDSTGRPIKRENVPIHIHRLNLPSGMTSLPWKFSIPRPGPPRSVVIPPKPQLLT